MDWHIDSKIGELLYHTIQAKHDKSPSCFRRFFVSYMLTVQGYLDWLVVMGHQEEVFQKCMGKPLERHRTILSNLRVLLRGAV